MPEELVGKISDFFAKPLVAGVELTGALKIGETIHIKGHTTDLEVVVQSMQLDNTSIEAAKPGQSIGIKVGDRVRKGDTVFKVV